MAGQPLDSDVLAVLQGPRPPVAPEVVSRDAQGRATVRATRLRAPLQIDGRLDEPVYETVQYITDFIQQLPDEGALSSERTEVWVLFDDDSIYISARCYDTAPPSEWVANEMRRDVIQLRQNDSFSLMLDTFYDRRNGLAFLVTPIGGFSDFAISNEGGRVNTDWNTLSGIRGPIGLMAAGRSRSRFRSSRCATGPHRPRCGGSSCGVSSGGGPRRRI